MCKLQSRNGFTICKMMALAVVRDLCRRSSMFKLCLLALGAATMTMLLAPVMAHAGTTGTGPLADVYTSLVSWVQGDVGETIALAMILVGIVAGIARQSLMAFAIGIGAGLGLYNCPSIISTVFSATIQAGMIHAGMIIH